MVTILFFLSSGLFLGWSLGANDAANIFGTAVKTRMVKFRTAAFTASVFIIAGSVISGSGATHTLGKLGSVNALPGAFTVAFSAGITVFFMTRLKLPVSTSQSIVGAIIGWNVFSGFSTDLSVLTKIVVSWVVSPIFAALFAIALSLGAGWFLTKSRLHLLTIDSITRSGLILIGAFGAYSLGANNIANVMGVFVSVSPFKEISVFNLFSFNNYQQLFLLGSVAIAVGVYTYSKKVMDTVGSDIFKMSPLDALVIVFSGSLVLFLFASRGLKSFLVSAGMPSLPLVPVSSSQVIVGAVLGIAFLKGGWKNINYGIIGKIAAGWISTPLISGIISFILLYFMQNVFSQNVFF